MANGKVIPRTPLAVDFWQIRKCPGTRLFFLSHMHSDHTVGLTSTWSYRPIYCSPTTATLLRLRLKVKEQWIHPLELDEPNLLPLDDIGKEKMTVTLIDANHCPGSVMFLFQGYFGSILYTGDFRYAPSILRVPCLRTNITIDVLYLDNTNCDPNRTIPSRERATQQIKEIIRRHPSHTVVIGLYSLGKESLLVELAMEFKTWVEVSVDRMETLKALELPEVFTTDLDAGRIRVVEQSEICAANFHHWNKQEPTLAILPTSRPLVSFHPNIYVVPYSDHSSYQELEDFVSALQPTSVVPIVGNHIPGSLSALLPSKKRPLVPVPESVQNYMLRASGSSAYSQQVHVRHIQPVVPRGVIFESPGKEALTSCEEASELASVEADVSEEEMDTASSEAGSNCILIDLSMELVPKKIRRQVDDAWNCGNIVDSVSESAVEESMPLTQGSFAADSVVRNARAGLQPTGTTRKLLQTGINRTIKDTAVYHTSHAQDGRPLSGCDGTSQQSGHRIDQEDDIESGDDYISQHNGRHQNNRAQRSADNEGCNAVRSLRVLRQEYVEEIENSILNDLPFTEEDLWPHRLLHQRPFQRFSTPRRVDKIKNPPDT